MSQSRVISVAVDAVVVGILLLLWAAYEMEGLRTFLVEHFWLLVVLAVVGFSFSVFVAVSYWKRIINRREK